MTAKIVLWISWERKKSDN